MHNVALDLKSAGHEVTGSDDAIFEPSRTRLEEAGLLPSQLGWFKENIHQGLDLVILGMHAREDNPELIQAIQLGIKVMSFPEYVASASFSKKRLVIAGSHGKTSTTAMVMHVLGSLGIHADYLVGSQLKGFDTMVRLSDAPLIVIEGDEYLSSPIDSRSKFLHYQPHIAIITGLAWDHINVFPTWESYVATFRQFIASIVPGGTLIYYAKDSVLTELVKEAPSSIKLVPYSLPEFQITNGVTSLLPNHHDVVQLKIFGAHNLENLEAARLMTSELGVSKENFYNVIQTFSGADRRLETLFVSNELRIIKDFAHAPSKVRASVQAVSHQFPDYYLLACFEPHTYSSLSPAFMKQYSGSLDSANQVILFLDKVAFELKRKSIPEENVINEAFQFQGLTITTEVEALQSAIKAVKSRPLVVLMMSSGNWGGLKLEELSALLNA